MLATAKLFKPEVLAKRTRILLLELNIGPPWITEPAAIVKLVTVPKPIKQSSNPEADVKGRPATSVWPAAPVKEPFNCTWNEMCTKLPILTKFPTCAV